MTAYERQIHDTEAYYDRQMALLECDDVEILSSTMHDSRLHDLLHNPYEEGIDEG